MNIVITGGGTGGHLYPGIELAKYYTHQGNKVYYIASKNGIDEEIINNINNVKFNIEYWDLKGLNRSLTLKSIINNIKNFKNILYYQKKAKKLLKNNNIDLVIAVGGYVTYPLLKSAYKLKIKTIMHEQNSYPGLVNRKMASKVNAIGIVYDSSKKFLQNQNIYNVSNPRVNICQKYKNNDYSSQLQLDPNKKKILFLGGSLGATTINNLFVEYVKYVEKNNKNEQCILISGLKNNEININEINEKHIIIKHTDELMKFISSSSIVISRGGATTLLEIINLEKKSIIIPSPNVVANHQYLNAKEFVDKKLIYMLEEENLTFDKFINNINKLDADKNIMEYLQNYNKINSFEEFDKLIGVINNDKNRKNN